MQLPVSHRSCLVGVRDPPVPQIVTHDSHEVVRYLVSSERLFCSLQVSELNALDTVYSMAQPVELSPLRRHFVREGLDSVEH